MTIPDEELEELFDNYYKDYIIDEVLNSEYGIYHDDVDRIQEIAWEWFKDDPEKYILKGKQ